MEFWLNNCNRVVMHKLLACRKPLVARFIRAIGTIALALLSIFVLVSATPLPPQVASEAEKQALWAAYQDRYEQFLASNVDDPISDLFEPVLDEAFITTDGKNAVLWLALRDYSGRVLATEPGMALATLSPGGWQVLLRGDPDWDELVSQLPEGFLPAEFQPAIGQDLNASPQTIWVLLSALRRGHCPQTRGFSPSFQQLSSPWLSKLPNRLLPLCLRLY